MPLDLDLFAGARGWEVGNPRLNALGIELDVHAAKVSEAAGYDTLQADVAALEPTDFGEVRGLIASPPCQTFSYAGPGKGRAARERVIQAAWDIHSGTHQWSPVDSDHRTDLVLQPLRYALALRPQWLAWEQVPPVLPIWQACAVILGWHGYTTHTGILSTEQHGLAQTRPRAFLIASRERFVSLPAPTHSAWYPKAPDKLDAGRKKWVTIREVLGDRDLPYLRSNKQSRATVRHQDQPAFTITAAGHDPFNRAWFDHPGGTYRPLSLAEAAKLQTFPESYPWTGNQRQRMHQVGNAVPPEMARIVLDQVM